MGVKYDHFSPWAILVTMGSVTQGCFGGVNMNNNPKINFKYFFSFFPLGCHGNWEISFNMGELPGAALFPSILVKFSFS